MFSRNPTPDPRSPLRSSADLSEVAPLNLQHQTSYGPTCTWCYRNVRDTEARGTCQVRLELLHQLTQADAVEIYDDLGRIKELERKINQLKCSPWGQSVQNALGMSQDTLKRTWARVEAIAASRGIRIVADDRGGGFKIEEVIP